MTATNGKAERQGVEGRIVRIANAAFANDSFDIESDLGVGTVEYYEILIGIEVEFGLSIPDADAENIKTVGQAVDYVMGRM